MVTNIFHDYHHSHVEGNYASNFLFWDAIFGDDVDFWKYKENKDEKKRLKAKKVDWVVL